MLSQAKRLDTVIKFSILFYSILSLLFALGLSYSGIVFISVLLFNPTEKTKVISCYLQLNSIKRNRMPLISGTGDQSSNFIIFVLDPVISCVGNISALG